MKRFCILVLFSFFLIFSVQLSAQESNITTGINSHWAFDETYGTVAVNSANVIFNAALESRIIWICHTSAHIPDFGARINNPTD